MALLAASVDSHPRGSRRVRVVGGGSPSQLSQGARLQAQIQSATQPWAEEGTRPVVPTVLSTWHHHASQPLMPQIQMLEPGRGWGGAEN